MTVEHPMKPLFNSDLIPQEIKDSLPVGYNIRPTQLDDYNRGILDCLSTLTTVGDIPFPVFKNTFEHWLQVPDTYYQVVITDASDIVVSVGTIFLERKLIHQCGAVGHIEDIAVSKNQQGKKLGIKLIKTLLAIGKQTGAYKVILDCSPHNVVFYEKCGLKVGGAEMVCRF